MALDLAPLVQTIIESAVLLIVLLVVSIAIDIIALGFAFKKSVKFGFICLLLLAICLFSRNALLLITFSGISLLFLCAIVIEAVMKRK